MYVQCIAKSIHWVKIIYHVIIREKGPQQYWMDYKQGETRVIRRCLQKMGWEIIKAMENILDDPSPITVVFVLLLSR